MIRTLSACLVLTVLISSPARAEPITYTEATIAPGSLGGVSFSGQLVTFTATADTDGVTGWIEDGGYYVATVKKILTGRRAPIPVILLHFYRIDQSNDIADLNPDKCSDASSGRSSMTRKPWWKFW